MDEKIENISAKDFKFNFTIGGKLNKDITQKEYIIKKEFEIAEVDNKADCIFTIGLNRSSNLSCDLNVENYKNIKTFSFKTAQVNSNDNEIYLSKFNDITLINSKEEDDETDKVITDNDNKKKENNQKEVIITIIVIFGVLIIILIIFLIRKSCSSKNKRVLNNFANNGGLYKNTFKPKNKIMYEVTSRKIY